MGTDCPALIVFGVATPVSPNSEPVSEISEIVRSAPPLFEIVNTALPVDPTLTVPNGTELLLKEICGPDEVAVAERFTTTGEVPSLPCTVIVPVTLPLEVGVTATITFPDCPAAMGIGNAAPDRLNCGFEKVAWVMEIAEFPVLEIATDWVLCFPTLTFPKLTLLGLT